MRERVSAHLTSYAQKCFLCPACGDEVIVEWRALTVTLIEFAAERLRAHLGLDTNTLPLAKILEGGTWAAGRQIARLKRTGGGPPIHILSNGSVF